jgi:hypothetical protein
VSQKRSKNRPKRLATSPIKNFQWHKCFDDSRFCLIFSFGGNYKILVQWKLHVMIFWWKLIFFGGKVWSMNSKKGKKEHIAI